MADIKLTLGNEPAPAAPNPTAAATAEAPIEEIKEEVQEEVKKSSPDALEVLTDAPCAVENIQRYAYHNGFKFEAVENGDEWTLKLTK